jgi:hypothetical protein
MAKLKARWKNPEADQRPWIPPKLGIAYAAMAATRGPATAAATQSPRQGMTVAASSPAASQVAVTKTTRRRRTCTGRVGAHCGNAQRACPSRARAGRTRVAMPPATPQAYDGRRKMAAL